MADFEVLQAGTVPTINSRGQRTAQRPFTAADRLPPQSGTPPQPTPGLLGAGQAEAAGRALQNPDANWVPEARANGGMIGARRFADGGSLDGGGKGPFTGDLNSDTTTFNQDYLRGPTFGQSSTAGLITPPTAAPAGLDPSLQPSGGGSADSQAARTTGWTDPNQNPDGSTNLAAQGDQNNSFLKNVGSGLAKALIPGLGLATNAYDFYQGATTGVSPSNNPSMANQLGAWTHNIGTNYDGTGISNSQAQQNNPNFGNEGNNAPAQASLGAVTQVAAPAQTASAATPPGASGASAPNPNAPPADPTGGILPQGTGTRAVVNNLSDFGPGGSSGDMSARASGDTAAGGYNPDMASAGSGSYANGGQIGAPQQPGLQMPGRPAAPAPAQPMHPALASLHVQNKMANPQLMTAIKTHISQAIQAGKINPQQLQMMGQLAQSAIQHPELWPKLREFAIQAGMPDAQQLPMQFSQGMAMAMLAGAHAAVHGDRPGAFANGGELHGPGNGTSDSIHAQNTSTGQPVKLSNGEYIIPADVVATKGKEFFDNIVRKYHTPAALQHGQR